MNVYKDITYCMYFNECAEGEGCEQALTAAVMIGAQKERAVIQQYVGPPLHCFVQPVDEKEKVL